MPLGDGRPGVFGGVGLGQRQRQPVLVQGLLAACPYRLCQIEAETRGFGLFWLETCAFVKFTVSGEPRASFPGEGRRAEAGGGASPDAGVTVAAPGPRFKFTDHIFLWLIFVLVVLENH